jgi:asparagine synthase (glutamine-hydrolysing)
MNTAAAKLLPSSATVAQQALAQKADLPSERAESRHGDLLLTFGERGPDAPQRYPDGECPVLASGQGWILRAQAPSSGRTWYPLRAIDTPMGPCWLVGELYGDAGRSAMAAERRIVDIVMGRSRAATLNGRFLLFHWREPENCWHLWTDRFGSLHAYYADDGRRAAIGTFFPATAEAASRRILDWYGITGFFSQGFFPRDRTFFDDVRICEPATHYVFDATGEVVKKDRYWAWRHVPERGRNYEDALAEFARLWTIVMDDSLRSGRIAIPVSGGLDSRTAVAACLPGRKPETPAQLWSYSYGYTADSAETTIARRVASARKLPFQAFTIEPYLFDRLDEVLASVEGFQDLTQCRQASVTGEIHSNADYLIAAHWGDVWMDTMGLDGKHGPDASEDLVVDHALGKIRKRGRSWLLENICRNQLDGDPEDVARDAVRGAMAPLGHIECPDFRVKAFKTDYWSFRWTMTSLRMYQPAAFPRLPFYDTRLADFFCGLPSQFVRERGMQVDYLKRFAPDLARITWQPFDASLYTYQFWNSLLWPKRALKKLQRTVGRRKAIQRNWEVQFLCADGRAGLERWLLRPGLRLHTFVSPAETAVLVGKLYETPGDPALGYTVSMLLTFSAWLERYA